MMADGKGPLGGLGGLGGMGDMMNAMKRAKEFSESAKSLQDELKDTEIEAVVREGAVKIIMTGQQQPVSVTVSDDLAAQGGAEVSKAVTECLIAVHSKSSDYMKGKMSSLTSSMFPLMSSSSCLLGLLSRC
jgi:nucleoid-associated protein EbfC